MKILYVCWDDLESYPPCLAQLDHLKNRGDEVVLVCNTDHKEMVMERYDDAFCCICLEKPDGHRMLDLCRRALRFRKTLRHAARRYGPQCVWYGTEDSAIISCCLLETPYIFNCLEYWDSSFKKYRLLGRIARKATVCISCETMRAWLMRFNWGLTSLPFVLPNKSGKHPRIKGLAGTIRESQQAISKIEGKLVILYQGWLTADRNIEAVAEALRLLDKDIILAVMAPDNDDTRRSIARLNALYTKVEYLGYIPAPAHLEVTSHATIGIARYLENSLNNAFCAPNKIFEYTGFGIPVLGNNVPGLQNSIGISHAGICVDFSDPVALGDAIAELVARQDLYAENAMRFFESIDTEKIIDGVLDAFESRAGKANG